MNEHERAYLRAQQGQFVARRYLFRGEWMTRAEVSRLTGWSNGAVANRIVGATIEDRPFISTGDRHRLGAKRFVFRGERLTVTEIVERTGQSRSWAYRRVSGDTILEEDYLPREQRCGSTLYCHQGTTLYLTQWARRLGIPQGTLYNRIYRGWPVLRALTEPSMRPDQRILYQGNRRTVRRIAFGFRRARNAEIIRRIASTIQTGGYDQTFALPAGTGVGSHPRDLHFQEGARP